jgi:FkbM family methyltransferase
MLQRIISSYKHRKNFYKYNKLSVDIEKPIYERKTLLSEGYFSQYGQDKWIYENLFQKKVKGTFVDIGAYDGITFSNTYFLEKIGWQGLAAEPIPSAYEKLIMNRHCISVKGCIAPNSGKGKFRLINGYSQMLSGLVDEYDERHVNRIGKELAIKGGFFKDIQVTCYNLNDLLYKYNIKNIDYLSIDVEGLELKILRSIDFNTFLITVIGVENNYKDYRIPKILTKKGFVFHSILGDEFYVNRNAI